MEDGFSDSDDEAADVELPPPLEEAAVKGYYGLASEVEAMNVHVLGWLQLVALVLAAATITLALPFYRWSGLLLEERTMRASVSVLLHWVVTILVIAAFWPMLKANHSTRLKVRIFGFVANVVLAAAAWLALFMFLLRRPYERVPVVAILAVHCGGLGLELLVCLATLCRSLRSGPGRFTAHASELRRAHVAWLIRGAYRHPRIVRDDNGGAIQCWDGTAHSSVHELLAHCARAGVDRTWLLDAPPRRWTRTGVAEGGAHPKLEAVRQEAVRQQVAVPGCCGALLDYFFPWRMVPSYGQRPIGNREYAAEKPPVAFFYPTRVLFVLASMLASSAVLCALLLETIPSVVDALRSQAGRLETCEGTGACSYFADVEEAVGRGFHTAAYGFLDVNTSEALPFLTPTAWDRAAAFRVYEAIVAANQADYAAKMNLSATNVSAGDLEAIDAHKAALQESLHSALLERKICLDPVITARSGERAAGSCRTVCRETRTSENPVESSYIGSCRMWDELADAAELSMLVGVIGAAAVALLSIVQTAYGYKAKVLQIRRGSAELARPSQSFGPRTAGYFFGCAVSCILLGICVLASTISLCVLVFMWRPTREWFWQPHVRDVWVAWGVSGIFFAVITVPLWILQIDWKFGTVKRARAYSLFNASMTLAYVTSASLVALLRLLSMILFVVVGFMRVDVTLFPRQTVGMDTPFASFIATIAVHEPATNPCAATFAELLLQRPTNGHSLSTMQRRLRNRMRLALLLTANPSLQRFRDRRIRVSEVKFVEATVVDKSQDDNVTVQAIA
mmetsp:Transcript_67639/g.190663  ORF Transcript_67639/g.190663 Transcript_67639/m.190663 type:complete len:794 (+) Transcript_67639:71-2452(+)